MLKNLSLNKLFIVYSHIKVLTKNLSINQYGVNGKLHGYFLKGVAIVNGDDTFIFEYKANREFTNRKSKIIDEGYPLASIQIIESVGKFKSELTKEEEKNTMDVEQKDIFDFILSTITSMEQNKDKKLTKGVVYDFR